MYVWMHFQKESREWVDEIVYGCWNIAKIKIFVICFLFMLYEVLFLLYISYLCCMFYHIFIIYLYVSYIFLFSIFILLDFKLLSSFVIMSLFSLHVQNWKYSYNKKYILIIRIFYVIWKFLLYDFHRPFSRQNLVVTSN